MRNQPFEIVACNITETRTPYAIEDRFSYSPERGYAWLQRACFWILRRLGCNAIGEHLVYTRMRIDPQSVLEALFEQREIAERISNGDISNVYMGPEDYRKLMRDEWHAGRLTFGVEMNRSRFEVMGLRVTIVPWMDGILVV